MATMTTHETLMQRFARRGVTPSQQVTRAEAERRVLETLDGKRGTRAAEVANAHARGGRRTPVQAGSSGVPGAIHHIES